ncbi:S8 family peptidase [Viridibacillus arvi]|uniref:S8 family peptidase n=1 Tax=Viridibacillus arvi TaxID=263475 RepID=UPI0034CFE465
MNNKKKTKTNIKGVVAKTTLAAMLLSSGLPAFQTTASASENPVLPTLPLLVPSKAAGIIEGEYIVTFKEGTNIDAMKADIAYYGGAVLSENWDSNMATVKLTEKQFKKMKNDSQIIEIIEENLTFATQGYGALKQYAHTKTNVPNAWAKNLKGKGIDIAILDTGIQKHSDLKVAGGVSTVNYTKSYSDDNGHGTHVAGIVASLDNGVGTTGVASEANIYAVKVLKANGKGDLIDIIEGVDWAIKKGVDIINISIGTNTNSELFKQKIDEARAKGIIVVAASGNYGDTKMTYPAKFDNVVSVGATDSKNKIASFSSKGDALNIVAPGAEIISTYTNEMYADANGTSSAAPYVAGMLALYKEAYPKKSAEEIIKMLYSNALDLGAKGKDTTFGYGLVQFPSIADIVEEPPYQGQTPSTINANVKLESDKKNISWNQFAEKNRYRIDMEQKDANGKYQTYRFARTVTSNKYELNLLEKGYQYRLKIVPQIGNVYDTSKTVVVYVSMIDGVFVSDSEITQKPIDNDEIKNNDQTSETINKLPQGIVFNSNPNKIVWEKFNNSSYYKIQMEQKQTNGVFTKFSYDRATSKTEFALSPLKEGYEYKLKVIPRDDNYKYDETKAKEIYVTYNSNKELKFYSKADPIGETSNVDSNKPSNEDNNKPSDVVEQKPNIPQGLAFNSSNHVLSWDKVDNAKKYRIEFKQKNNAGVYVAYSFNRNIMDTNLDLDILPINKEYQITIVPYIGFAYDYNQSKSLYVNTSDFSINGLN